MTAQLNRFYFFLDDLSDKEIRIFFYRFYLKRTYEDIATVLKSTPKKIKRLCKQLFSEQTLFDLIPYNDGIKQKQDR